MPRLCVRFSLHLRVGVMSETSQATTKLGLWSCAVVFLAMVAFAFGKMKELEQELVRSNAIENAAQFSAAIREFRTIYTNEVVKNVKQHGIEVTHDYREKEGAIPLPATLSMLLGNRLASQGGGKTRLYSEYPFPWRIEERGPLSAQDRETIVSLSADPDTPVFMFDMLSEHPTIRFSTADLMRDACVNCHNTHPLTPKNDWKAGDVRGVVEVSLPLDAVIARTRESFSAVWLLVGSATLVVLGIMAYLGVSIVQRSRVLIDRERALDDEAKLRALAEFELERSEAHRSFILDSANEAIVAMNPDGKITEFNQGAQNIFGHSRDVAIGSRVVDLLVPEDNRQAHNRGVARLLGSGDQSVRGQYLEVSALRADGSEVLVQVSIAVAKNEGEVSFIASMHDITERKAQEAKLHDALETAEKNRHDLEAFNHFSVDRELRMVTLKEEINGLLEADGKEPKYVVGDEAEETSSSGGSF